MTASRRRQTSQQHHQKSQQQQQHNAGAAGNTTSSSSSGAIGNIFGSAKDRRERAAGGGAAATASTPTRVINAGLSLEKAEMYGIDDDRPVFSRAMALAGRMFIETIPQWLAVGAMLSLIFGGCCSNVFALEAIVKVEPASGMFSPPKHCHGEMRRSRKPKVARAQKKKALLGTTGHSWLTTPT